MTEKFRCLRCCRTFLTENALDQHYDWEPEHAKPVTINAGALGEQGAKLENSEWVDFEDRIETFLTVPERVDEHGLEMVYDPDEGTVVVTGIRDQTIDVRQIQELASNQLRWSFDGRHLILAFQKRE